MSRNAKNGEPSGPDLPHLCRQVAEQSSVPMAAVEGTEHNVCYVNPAFCRLIGRPSEELIGIPFARAVPEAEACLPLLDRVSATGEPQNCMEEDHPGSHPHWSYALWAIPGASTRPAGIMIQVTDATRTAQVRQQAAEMNQELMLAAVRQHELLEAAERLSAGLQVEIGERERAEASLRDTTGMLEELVAASPVGITSLDPEGRVLLWNPAMETISGWSEAEVRGKLPPAVEAGQEGAREAFERLLAGERLARVELRRVRKDGRPVDLLLWTAPVRGESGRLKNTVVIFLDITPFKEMEQVALAQQKLASLGQVAAGIAHEIRNPLSGINLYLHSLETFLTEVEFSNPEIRETTEALISSMKEISARMETVIQRVLAFSRPGPTRMEPLDVNACIRDAIALVRVLLQKAGAQVSVAVGETLPMCRGDRHLIAQALLNLMTNAAEAMERQEGERRIEIGSSWSTASSRDGFVTVSVADSGPGVPEEVREKIFEPFFTTRQGGTGIGLSITHRIVTAHGGFIKVGTSRFGGALFTIGLPAGDEGNL